MSETPAKNLNIAYSDEINSSATQLEFVKQSETGPGSEDGQYIYTMPRAFRFGSKTNSGNKVGLLVMFFGLLLFIALVYVGFLVLSKKPIFNFNPDNSVESVSSTNTISPTTTSSPINQAEEVSIDLSDPEQAYLQLRLKLDQALTLEDYLNIFIAGASQDKAHQLYEQTIGLEALSASQKSSTLSISKTMLIPLSSADQITKEINGNQATLTITKADTNRSAIVKLLLEDGQWRFDNEGWQDNFIEPATSSPAIIDEPILDDNDDFIIKEFSLDVDTDQDGLTDKEEIILGTNPNSSDSDSDGYDDLTELRSGYNPAGSGKLGGNKGLRLIKHGDWSILMPSLWSSQLGRDNSAIFRADDGQFIQLNIANKPVNQSLIDWYQEIFKVFTEQIPDILIIDQHQAVFSPDGLTYYITKPELDYLISLTYSPESNNLLSYNNIFHLMSDSLTIDN